MNASRRVNDYHSSDSARVDSRRDSRNLRRAGLLDCVGDRMQLNRDREPRTYRNFYTAAQRTQARSRSFRNGAVAVLVIAAALIIQAVR